MRVNVMLGALNSALLARVEMEALPRAGEDIRMLDEGTGDVKHYVVQSLSYFISASGACRECDIVVLKNGW